MLIFLPSGAENVIFSVDPLVSDPFTNGTGGVGCKNVAPIAYVSFTCK